MAKKGITVVLYLILITISVLCVGCLTQKQETSEVVVYTSVDQIYSEEVFKEFETKTGIKVKPAYDVEATKTTGLVQRLIAEKDQPRADVFWSGEIIQTIKLKKEGVLMPYNSLNAADIPETFRDPEGYWTGFAGRARIILVNTDLVPQNKWPSSIYDFINTSWPGNKVGLAMPVFGTTSTHAAGLYAVLGAAEGRQYFEEIKAKGVSVLDGNSAVKDQVAKGELLFGLTDTDDACQAINNGAPVKIIFPDQGEGGLGTFVIPNTVGMVKGSSHTEEAKKFIDFLLSKETENKLVEMGWCHFPVRPVSGINACVDTGDIREMEVDYGKVYLELGRSTAEMREIFVQ